MVSLEEVFVNLGINAEAMLEKTKYTQENNETQAQNKIPSYFLRGGLFSKNNITQLL